MRLSRFVAAMILAALTLPVATAQDPSNDPLPDALAYGIAYPIVDFLACEQYLVISEPGLQALWTFVQGVVCFAWWTEPFHNELGGHVDNLYWEVTCLWRTAPQHWFPDCTVGP